MYQDGYVTVHRPSGGTAILRKFQVYINDRVVGTISNGGQFNISLIPGYYSVYLEVDWSPSNTVNFYIGRGQHIHLYCKSPMTMRKILRPQSYLFRSSDSDPYIVLTFEP